MKNIVTLTLLAQLVCTISAVDETKPVGGRSEARRAGDEAAISLRIAAAIGGKTVEAEEDRIVVDGHTFRLSPVNIEREKDWMKVDGTLTRYVAPVPDRAFEPAETVKFQFTKNSGQPVVFYSDIDDGKVWKLLEKTDAEIQQWARGGGKFTDGTWAGAARQIMARLVAAVLRAERAEFMRKTTFESVDSFVTTARLFRPSVSKSDLAKLFVQKPIEGDAAEPPVTAKVVEFAENLWADDKEALVFVSAKPPTENTCSAVGFLFLLGHERAGWRVKDLRRFTASGKYAAVFGELTSGSDTHMELGDAVVTIRESQGGRGFSYQVSASFTVRNGKLKKMDLE